MDPEAARVGQLIADLRAGGYDPGQWCVVGEGVFFNDHGFAEAFSKRHDKELVPVTGVVTGWLAKNRATPPG